MIFIETSIFTRLLPKYLSDDEYRAFQWHLMAYPDAGDVFVEVAELEKLDGQRKERGKGVESESSIIGKNRPMKYGC